eukprot:s1774_g11.t1
MEAREAGLSPQHQRERSMPCDELQALEKGAERLGQVAYTINGEIESQQKLLDELNQDIEKEMERMDVVTKGMGALLKTSNKAQIYAVGGAIVLFVILDTWQQFYELDSLDGDSFYWMRSVLKMSPMNPFSSPQPYSASAV